MDMNLGKLKETVEDRGAWHVAVPGSQTVGQDLATEQQHIYRKLYIFILFHYRLLQHTEYSSL